MNDWCGVHGCLTVRCHGRVWHRVGRVWKAYDVTGILAVGAVLFFAAWWGVR